MEIIEATEKNATENTAEFRENQNSKDRAITHLEQIGIRITECMGKIGEQEYIDGLEKFLKSYDFMRIGQTVNRKQWQSAMMTLRRMEQEMKRLGIDCMLRQILPLRMAISERNELRAKNTLALLVQKRVQLLPIVTSMH